MGTSRVAAFSDGVLAILITVMLLQLPRPAGADWSALHAVWPTLASYVLSFILVGIYWNNHHHLLAIVETINGQVLWVNLVLLFWLSLLPYVTAWVGDSRFAPIPMATYAAITLLSAVSFILLGHSLRKADPQNVALAQFGGRRTKEHGSLIAYSLALVAPLLGHLGAIISAVLQAVVALWWIVPDPRIEHAMKREGGSG